MIHPEHVKRIHRYLELIWRDGIVLDPPLEGLPEMEPSLEEAKEILSREPGFSWEFKKGRLHFGNLLWFPESYWKLLLEQHPAGELKQLLVDREAQWLEEGKVAELAAAWVGLFGDLGKTRELLVGADTKPFLLGTRISMHYQLAAAWVHLFSDTSRARGLLDYPERNLKTIREHVRFIHHLFGILGDRVKGRNLIHKIEEMVSDIPGFCGLAVLWLCYFDDKEKARDFLEKAEKKFKELPQEVDSFGEHITLLNLVESWVELFENRDHARALLEETEKSSLGIVFPELNCWMWIVFFKDYQHARELLEKEERDLARHLPDLPDVPGLTDVPDLSDSDSRRFLPQAERWSRVLNDTKKVKINLERAEDTAKTPADFFQLACHYWTLLGSEEKKNEFLQKAQEASAKEEKSCYSIRAALVYLEDRNMALELFHRDLAQADSSWEFKSLAKTAIEVLKDREELSSLLQLWEKKTKEAEEFGEIAKHWALEFEDRNKARKTLEKAFISFEKEWKKDDFSREAAKVEKLWVELLGEPLRAQEFREISENRRDEHFKPRVVMSDKITKRKRRRGGKRPGKGFFSKLFGK